MHSMKGGCGKSASALFKAIQLAEQNKIDDRKARVLFIDADFKGSALQTLFFENTETDAYLYHKLLEQYSNHIVKGKGLTHHLAVPDNYAEDRNLNKFFREKKMSFIEILNESFSYTIGSSGEADSAYEELMINGFLDFIFSSSDNRDKGFFKRGSQDALEIGIYKYRMSVFFKQILEYGKVDEQDIGQYSDLVIDMPPGYDEYSDLILEELQKLAEKKKVELHYYSVTTNDIGHMRLTRDNIEKKLGISTSYQSWAGVNVILTCMRESDFDIHDGKVLEVNNDIINLCKLLYRDNSKVYRCSYQDNYYKFCRSHIISEFDCPTEFEEITEEKGELKVLNERYEKNN